MVETQHFDIAVIGGGAGLAKIASPCSKAGYKVALFERETLGGTCLNRGCIPSKMLICMFPH
jgi:dihydrolipoamide dehydrogenase